MMTTTVKTWFVLAAAGALACGEKRSAPELATDSATAANLAVTPALTDANVAALLDNRHQAEISLATTARASASSPAVRDYAARMIAEHSAMKRALDSLVATKRIIPEMPEGVEPIQASIAGLADTLLNTTGRSTDIAYINGEMKRHGEAAELLNRYAGAAKDEDLRLLIRREIGEVRLHLDRAIDILRGL